MEQKELRTKYEKIKKDLMQTFDEKLDDVYQQIQLASTHELNDSSSRDSSFVADRDGSPSHEKHVRRKEDFLQEKKFLNRPSLLTELFLSSHIRTIYHFFIAILIVLILNSMIHDLFDSGTKMPIVITLWICMFLVVILVVYPSFHYWAHSLYAPGFYNYIWLSAYAGFLISMLVIPIRCMVSYDLPIASSMIVVCEQVRFIMKVHAFVRGNIPKALKYRSDIFSKKVNQESDLPSPCPSFDKYLYFLFAPTLIYRDEYPRTENVDWNSVVYNFGQVIGCLFYVYYAFSHFCVPIFQNFNKDHITLRTFITSTFSSILPGALCFLLAFFAVLHAWHNAFAEMLRFGDRMFYRDWWNSTNFSNYYRTWNVIVHDWLYTYVYRDVYLLFGSRSRAGAMISVFWLSALVHEYIIIVVFRFFYPVLFVEFFFAGVALLFLTSAKQKQVWNVVFWVGMLIGTGMMMCLYSMEWYARANCPPSYENVLIDYLVPRSWTCVTSSTDVGFKHTLN